MAHYCVVRADLPHGAQLAQIIHAAGESSPGNMSSGTFAIALAARDEAHLKEISWKLMLDGVVHRLIVESDSPYTGQLMSIGIPPQPRSRLKKLLSNLPLAK